MNDKLYFVRDHIGIIPLYWGTNDKNELFVCSELKGIEDRCDV